MMKRNQEAVSPVIGVILMVAITVVLAAILYVWASGFVGTAKATPRGETVTTNLGNDYQFTFRTVSKKVAVFDITYQILDSAGVTIREGRLETIYGLREDRVGGEYVNPDWRITFLDNDLDGFLTAGDQIIIRGILNVDPTPNAERIYGVAGNQWRLIFEQTGSSIIQKSIT